MRIILIILTIAFTQNVLSQKISVIFPDTNYITRFICESDSFMPIDDLIVGDTVYNIDFLKLNNRNEKYDTIVVFYDSLMKDTMITYVINIDKKYSCNKQFFRDGKLKSIDDTRIGVSQSWYKNSQLKSIKTNSFESLNYVEQLDEKNKTWYPSGKLKTECKFLPNDTIIVYYYYEDGNIQFKNTLKSSNDITVTGINGKYFVYFIEERFCSNGNREWIFNYSWYNPKNIQKNYEEKYCNGQTKYRYEIFSSRAHFGKFTAYHDNGVISIEGQFPKYEKFDDWKYRKKCNIMFSEIPIGTWKYYDKNGKLLLKEEYNECGKLLKSKKY